MKSVILNMLINMLDKVAETPFKKVSFWERIQGFGSTNDSEFFFFINAKGEMILPPKSELFFEDCENQKLNKKTSF